MIINTFKTVLFNIHALFFLDAFYLVSQKTQNFEKHPQLKMNWVKLIHACQPGVFG